MSSSGNPTRLREGISTLDTDDKALAAFEKFLKLWPVDDPLTARERSEARSAIARLRDAPRR